MSEYLLGGAHLDQHEGPYLWDHYDDSQYGKSYWHREFKKIDGANVWFDGFLRINVNWDDIEIRRSYGRIEAATMRFNIVTKYPELADEALLRFAPQWLFGTLYATEHSVSRTGPRSFEGTVEYSIPDWPRSLGTDSFELSFDTSGGMQHIKQSYQTLGRHAASGAQPNNYHGAIGVHDGSIAGCDVIVPSLSFSVNHTARGFMTMSFIRSIAEFTGRVNATPFWGFNVGDVLLERATGSQSMNEEGEYVRNLSYTFRVCPTVYNLQVGNINVGYKAGWDYFWVEYEDTFDYNCVSKSMVPKAAYIEQVYKSADFNVLMLPIMNLPQIVN